MAFTRLQVFLFIYFFPLWILAVTLYTTLHVVLEGAAATNCRSGTRVRMRCGYQPLQPPGLLMFVTSTSKLVNVCGFNPQAYPCLWLPSKHKPNVCVLHFLSLWSWQRPPALKHKPNVCVFHSLSLWSWQRPPVRKAASGGSPLTSALNLMCGVNHSHCGHLQRSLSQSDTVQVGLAWRRGPNRDWDFSWDFMRQVVSVYMVPIAGLDKTWPDLTNITNSQRGKVKVREVPT